MFRFLVRRLIRTVLLIVVVSSAALLLVHLAPGDGIAIGEDRRSADAERARLGLDRPFIEQYASWLGRLVRLDFGESSKFRRPVATLLGERVINTVVLGSTALVLAIGLGIPAGVMTGSGARRWWAKAISSVSLLLVATPPLVTALLLLLIAARTGWLSLGVSAAGAGGVFETTSTALRQLSLPALALALPIAAVLERLQSKAMEEALQEPCVAAARARGVSIGRAIWTHAFRLSLRPVVAMLGIVIGTVLSGSFIVEIMMAWPGLGDLMQQALFSRDTKLAAGCAASGTFFLAIGLLAADIVLMLLDPRTIETA